ncbi:hypothetical protein MKW98_007233 [Papaver atlanticum]|uniref:Uncharacterized protein n=1 Tax=Papaver atlanticum TaxID=357466 RepID=A0AAD4SP62_9MAGN|nr:hypothetical protein MKW98_007233 [Papaver atlanticum]
MLLRYDEDGNQWKEREVGSLVNQILHTHPPNQSWDLLIGTVLSESSCCCKSWSKISFLMCWITSTTSQRRV